MIEALDAWLAAQRWFRAKQRPVAGVSVLDRAPVGPAELTVLEVAYRDGGPPDRYLAPLVGGREPRDGEGAWLALAEVIVAGVTIDGEAGQFVATSAADARAALEGATERRMRVEQSNTSAVIGERRILKLYRLLEPGENPDVEVGTFLTDAGFADTPAVAGSLRYVPADGEPAAAAMLQALVPTTGDGWAAMLEALADDPRRATALAGAAGSLTARMHAALASRPEHPDFPFRAATAEEVEAWRASAEEQVDTAIASVEGSAKRRLVELAPRIRQRFERGFAAHGLTASRIHGDYHLGQLLARTDGGLSVIDFEGEPARPLAERRRPGSPLRDVAGMLRSLDYAARTAQRSGSLTADAWLPAAREAFLAPIGAGGPQLEAFELEKACYEVRYEANNRPDWLWLPVAAVERLVGGAA